MKHDWREGTGSEGMEERVISGDRWQAFKREREGGVEALSVIGGEEREPLPGLLRMPT